MRPAADYRNFLWEAVVSGIPIRMEVATESIHSFGCFAPRPGWYSYRTIMLVTAGQFALMAPNGASDIAICCKSRYALNKKDTNAIVYSWQNHSFDTG